MEGECHHGHHGHNGGLHGHHTDGEADRGLPLAFVVVAAAKAGLARELALVAGAHAAKLLGEALAAGPHLRSLIQPHAAIKALAAQVAVAAADETHALRVLPIGAAAVVVAAAAVVVLAVLCSPPLGLLLCILPIHIALDLLVDVDAVDVGVRWHDRGGVTRDVEAGKGGVLIFFFFFFFCAFY